MDQQGYDSALAAYSSRNTEPIMTEAEAREKYGDTWWLGHGAICNCGQAGCIYSTFEAAQDQCDKWGAIQRAIWTKDERPWWRFW